MTQKKYHEMNGDEQLRFVKELQAFIADTMPALVALGKSRSPWTADNRRDMELGLRLLGAFPFAEKFVADALRYGDYAARSSRLPVYFGKAKDVLAQGLNITQQGGQRYVLVDPTIPAHRRGRPSREEMAARRKGEVYVTADPGMELQRRLASLLGLNVVVTDNAPRELNNDELAVIRQKKQEEYDRQNPSLFAPKAPVPVGSPAGEPSDQGPAGQAAGTAADSVPGGSAAAPSVAAATMPDGSPAGDYGTGIEALADTRLHLDQLKPLLTKDLQMQVEQVRVLRQRAATAAETAKAMALRGEQPEAVEPYAQEAAACTEQYEAIYDAVDRELGTVWFRLQNDGEFRDRFQQHHRIKDLTVIAKQLKPYYQKVSSPEFDASVQRIIEQESPAYVAKVKAEQEKKEEVQGILRYLRRTDKPNALTRRNTARERFARLQQLLGEQEAEYYRPYLTKIEEDYDQNFRPADEAKAKAEKAEAEKKAPVSDASPSGKKKASKKAK